MVQKKTLATAHGGKAPLLGRKRPVPEHFPRTSARAVLRRLFPSHFVVLALLRAPPTTRPFAFHKKKIMITEKEGSDARRGREEERAGRRGQEA